MDLEALNKNNLEDSLKSKELQLYWLLQITKAINYNLPKKQLFEFCENLLLNHLKVEKVVLFVNEQGWVKKIDHGHSTDLSELNPAQEFSGITDIEEQNYQKSKWLEEFETVIPVFHNGRALAYGLIAGIDGKSLNETKHWLPFIHTVINIVVVAVENKRLGNEALLQAEMKKELELARDMQNMLLPVNLSGNNVFDIAAYYRPHKEVGGDYYDYITINEKEAIICMADVSGKGMAAALLMSNFQANLRVMLKYTQSLTDIVTELNSTVSKSAKGEKFITFFIAKVNSETRTIEYVNAGHNHPFLFCNEEFILLDKGTVGLGMLDELPFLNSGQEKFPAGSLLLCYTDGVVELENPEGEDFGIEKLMELVKRYQNVFSMKDLHLIIMDTLEDFRKDCAYTDDVTLMSCRSLEG